MDQPLPPDGVLICHNDKTGRRVAVLPATCKAGTHLLTVAQRGAAVHGDQLCLTCPACAAVPGVDHTWRLTLTEPTPERAELDDGPYSQLYARSVGTIVLDSA